MSCKYIACGTGISRVYQNDNSSDSATNIKNIFFNSELQWVKINLKTWLWRNGNKSTGLMETKGDEWLFYSIEFTAVTSIL